MVTQLDLFGNHVDVQAKDPIWILKNRPAPDPNSPIVVSYGGGTNSTAMLIAMVLKGIKPDLILFADTGGGNCRRRMNGLIRFLIGCIIKDSHL